MRLSKATAVTLLVLGLGAFFVWVIARLSRPDPTRWEEQEPRQEFGRPKRH